MTGKVVTLFKSVRPRVWGVEPRSPFGEAWRRFCAMTWGTFEGTPPTLTDKADRDAARQVFAAMKLAWEVIYTAKRMTNHTDEFRRALEAFERWQEKAVETEPEVAK